MLSSSVFKRRPAGSPSQFRRRRRGREGQALRDGACSGTKAPLCAMLTLFPFCNFAILETRAACVSV